MNRHRLPTLALAAILAVTVGGSAAVSSKKCCGELGFPNSKGSDEVCSQTDLPGKGCNAAATWTDARQMCKDIGARLCTRNELVEMEGQESSVCNFDDDALVWTNNRCNGDINLRYAARMDNGRGRECLARDDQMATAAVICCADASDDRPEDECSNAQTATYTVTLRSNWVEDPAIGSEHFTAVVGWAHDGSREGRHWGADGDYMATSGVEGLAEIGATGRILRELRELETMGTVLAPERKTGDLFTPVRSESWTITVDRDHPWASHLSMIAPSPDWFIGNHQNLLSRDGTWVERVTKRWGTYDAGTEEGTEFSLSNRATEPQEPISSLTAPLENGAGTIRFELKSCK